MSKNSMPYTAEQKLEILKYCEKNGIKSALQKFNCTEQSIYRWKKRYDGSLDSLKPKFCPPITPHPNSHTEEERKQIMDLLLKHPNISHKELYQKLKDEYGYTRHPHGLYNYLRRNHMIPTPKQKIDHSTMFDERTVKLLNEKHLYKIRNELPKYAIEINESGIFLAKMISKNPCGLTRYYSMTLLFNSEKEAQDFIDKTNNTSVLKLTIKELIFER